MNRGSVNGDALEAFSQFASQFDTDDDDWQDMGSDEYFVAGYEAGIASTRNADDDEPVTEEWLLSVGFSPDCVAGYINLEHNELGTIQCIVFEDSGPEWNLFGGDWGDGPKTRGQLRLLFRALGIDLQEAKDK